MKERFNLSKLPPQPKPVPAGVRLPRLNGYRCQSKACGHLTITVDVDEGVTPFAIGCTKCQADAYSMFYPQRGAVPPVTAATHEWYKPDAAEVATLHPASADHVEKGGLLMRPRTERAAVYHA